MTFKPLLPRAILLRSILLGTIFASTTTVGAVAADQIRIVGSSTVYPFTTVVAERFGRTTDFATPIVESTGTGGGFKLFCASSEVDTPSVSNASRAIKSTEIDLCAGNGVNKVIEVKVGYDGIVLANSKKAETYEVSIRDIYLALAEQIPAEDGTLIDNPYQTWKDVNRALPARKIEVLGPPPTSGTRDAFIELVMEKGCAEFPVMAALNKSDKKAFKEICHSMREDGAFVEAGENDNLIVQRLQANPDALGIFGFSFLDQNSDVVKAAVVNGVVASFDEIAEGHYPIARPLFFYVKGEHFNTVGGLREFIAEFTSPNASGEDGYLSDRGLIPLPEDERRALKARLAEELASR